MVIRKAHRLNSYLGYQLFRYLFVARQNQVLIVRWTDVELDGIRWVRRYTRLRQGEHVQPMVVDDVMDENCLASTRADIEHAKGQGVASRRAGARWSSVPGWAPLRRAAAAAAAPRRRRTTSGEVVVGRRGGRSGRTADDGRRRGGSVMVTRWLRLRGVDIVPTHAWRLAGQSSVTQYIVYFAKCGQDRHSIQNTENRHADKRKNLWKNKNTRKHAKHIHTLKIYKASLKTLKQVTNENIAQYSELRLFYLLVHQFKAVSKTMAVSVAANHATNTAKQVVRKTTKVPAKYRTKQQLRTNTQCTRALILDSINIRTRTGENSVNSESKCKQDWPGRHVDKPQNGITPSDNPGYAYDCAM